MMRTRSLSRGFTLAELLAVIGVIAVLAVVVSMSAQRISKDAKISSATNQVIAALGQARAIAIRDHATVLIGFRVRRPTYRQSDGTEVIVESSKQQTEIVIAKATGRVGFPGATVGIGSYTIVFPFAAIDDLLIEEFEPVEGLPPKLLPVGTKVAGSGSDLPAFLFLPSPDLFWLSQPRIKSSTNAALNIIGSMIVVRFAPDGSIQTRNPTLSANATSTLGNTSSVAPYIDFNRNNRMDIGTTNSGTSNTMFFSFDESNDEPLGQNAMFLAVFDDDLFAEIETLDGLNWQDVIRRRTPFVDQFADRIHFNRLTGVAEVVPR